MIRAISAAAIGAMAILLLPAAVHADDSKNKSKDKDIVDYREHIMKTLNEQSAALGQILSTTIPGDNTAAHLEAIALTASLALKSFEPKVPGGEAKPDVWAKWPDFSKRMTDFAQKTAEMAKISREKGTDAALQNVVEALSCKSCHDVYRAEKK